MNNFSNVTANITHKWDDMKVYTYTVTKTNERS